MKDCFFIDKDKLYELGYYSIPGKKGKKGKTGTGIETKGNYKTLDELIEKHPTGNEGDTFIAGKNLYCWNKENNTWQNVGNISGEKGDQGDIGPVGNKGDQGDKGDKGDKGEKGDQGDKGDKGKQGKQGNKGSTGDTGPIGNKGEKGPTGEKGIQGDQGKKGTQGDKGPTGDIGMQITCNSFLVSSTNKNTTIDANSIPYSFNSFHYGDHIFHDVNSEFFTLKKNHRYYIKVFITGLAETINPIKGGIYLDNRKIASIESANNSGFCYAMAMTVTETKIDQYLRISLGPNFTNFNSTINIMSVL